MVSIQLFYATPSPSRLLFIPENLFFILVLLEVDSYRLAASHIRSCRQKQKKSTQRRLNGFIREKKNLLKDKRAIYSRVGVYERKRKKEETILDLKTCFFSLSIAWSIAWSEHFSCFFLITCF